MEEREIKEVDEFIFQTTNETFINGILELGGFKTEDGVGLYVSSDYSEEFKKEIEKVINGK